MDMDVEKLQTIISIGEGHTTEFKKSTEDITRDVYESVCAFSNRDGGHVFLGIKDNGEILGIKESCIQAACRNLLKEIFLKQSFH